MAKCITTTLLQSAAQSRRWMNFVDRHPRASVIVPQDLLQAPVPVWLAPEPLGKPVDESPHLRCQLARTRIKRPKRLCRDERVVGKGWYEDAGSKLVRGAPGGHQRNTEPRTGSVSNGTAVIDAKAWGDPPLNRVSVLAMERPEIESADGETAMLCQVVRRLRSPAALDIFRRGDQHPFVRSEAARDKGRIAKFSIPHCHIESAFDKIDHAVRDAQVQRQLRILSAEIGQSRHDMHTCERRRSRHPEGSARGSLLSSQCRSGGLCREHDLLCMRQEGKSVLRQCSLTCCPMKKSSAQLPFERCQPSTCAGGCEAQVASCRADASELGNADKKP
ncbi:hypothetical protein PANO111632_19645 [Paracoccus nototheniae]